MNRLFGVDKKVSFGWYLIGSVLIIMGNFLGQIPFGIVAVYSSIKKGGSMPTQTVDLLLPRPLMGDQSHLLKMATASASIYLIASWISWSMPQSLKPARLAGSRCHISTHVASFTSIQSSWAQPQRAQSATSSLVRFSSQ